MVAACLERLLRTVVESDEADAVPAAQAAAAAAPAGPPRDADVEGAMTAAQRALFELLHSRQQV